MTQHQEPHAVEISNDHPFPDTSPERKRDILDKETCARGGHDDAQNSKVPATPG